MPRLPSIDDFQRQTPQAQRGVVGYDGTAASQAMGQLGKALSAAADEYRVADEKKQRAAAGLAMVRIKNELHDAHDQIQRGIEDGSLDAGKAESLMQERSRQIRGEGTKDFAPAIRASIAPELEAADGSLRRSILGVATRRRQNEVGSTIGQFAEEKGRDAMRLGPGIASSQFAGFVDFAGPEAGLAPEAMRQLKQNFTERTYRSFYETAGVKALDQGDAAELRRLREQIAGPDGEALDPNQRASLILQFHGWEQSLGAQSRFNVTSRTKDYQTMVLAGVAAPDGVAPTPEEYQAAYGANGKAMWQQEIGNYERISGGIRAMSVADAAERGRMVAEASPTPGVGFAGELSMQQTLQQAKQAVEKAIIADPAEYVLKQSTRVQRAGAVLQRVLSDPSQSAEDKVAATDLYARVTSAEQLRLGVDTIRDENTGNKLRGPKLLTNAQANQIADVLSDTSNGGAAIVTTIQGLEQQWGKHWPQVYGQLAADNKLSPAALVIPNMRSDASRTRMAQVMVMKPDELKALIDPKDSSEIREKLLTEFKGALGTFTAQGADGNRTLAKVVDATERLAILYRSQGQDVPAAARQAYDETMGHAFTFKDTYRVPKAMNAAAVARGAGVMLDDVVKGNQAQVFSGSAPIPLTQDALRSRSMWVTNGDETGLELRVRGADGGIYAVQGPDGKTISRTWADLMSRASADQAHDDTREGHAEWLRQHQRDVGIRRDGLLEPGNIDLSKRPVVKNSDGTVSTVRSIGVNIDGQEVLIPTVSDDGNVLSEPQAIEQYKRTGKHLGKFATSQASDAYAQQLHRQQERMYGGKR